MAHLICYCFEYTESDIGKVSSYGPTVLNLIKQFLVFESYMWFISWILCDTFLIS